MCVSSKSETLVYKTEYDDTLNPTKERTRKIKKFFDLDVLSKKVPYVSEVWPESDDGIP